MSLRPMSAIGPKRTCGPAQSASAFGGKADATRCSLKGSPRTLGTEFSYTARERLRRSGFPRSRLRGSGHRRGSLPRTSPNSSITSALILFRQLAKVSLVAPAARSSFHRARITAISRVSGQSAFVFVFVMAPSVGGRLLKARCRIRRNALIPTRGDILGGYRFAPTRLRPIDLCS